MISLEDEQVYVNASSRVFEQLPHDAEWVNCYALGSLACAEAMIEGNDSAMTMARDSISKLNLEPGEAFGVWADLLRQGLAEALPHARHAAGIAGEKVTFLESIGAVQLNGLHSAERLVELVLAGDKDSIPLAREIARNTSAIERTALLGQLYMAGDSESLNLAIESATEAKAYCDITGDTHYYRSEKALLEMGLHAAKAKNVEDAVRITRQLEDDERTGYIFAELCKEGFMQYAPKVMHVINSTDNKYTAQELARELALSGFPSAIMALKYRSLSQKPPELGGATGLNSHLRDLVVLHSRGYEEAAIRLKETLDQMTDPLNYVHYLGAVSLKTEQLQLAEKIFTQDPTYRPAIEVVRADFTVDRWQRAFDLAMAEYPEPYYRSKDVNYLAHKITQ